MAQDNAPLKYGVFEASEIEVSTKTLLLKYILNTVREIFSDLDLARSFLKLRGLSSKRKKEKTKD